MATADLFRIAITAVIVFCINLTPFGFVAWLLIYLEKPKSSIGGGYNY